VHSSDKTNVRRRFHSLARGTSAPTPRFLGCQGGTSSHAPGENNKPSANYFVGLFPTRARTDETVDLSAIFYRKENLRAGERGIFSGNMLSAAATIFRLLSATRCRQYISSQNNEKEKRKKKKKKKTDRTRKNNRTKKKDESATRGALLTVAIRR
jgi:hypothetical protein